MFRNVRKKPKKFESEKKVKNKKISSCSSFVFAPYNFISPNLQIIFLKKNTYPGRSQRGGPILKIAKKLVVNPRKGTLTETPKTLFVLQGLMYMEIKFVQKIDLRNKRL